MPARVVLIAFMALAALPQQQMQTLLDVGSLSDAVSRLVVYGYPDGVEVQLVGQAMPHPSPERGPLFGMPLQVWLLRGDGTVVGLRSKPVRTDLIQPFARTEIVHFYYQPVPPNELAGVVISENGKLYVREIKVKSTP
jgi:hypothetical protein